MYDTLENTLNQLSLVYLILLDVFQIFKFPLYMLKLVTGTIVENLLKSIIIFEQTMLNNLSCTF